MRILIIPLSDFCVDCVKTVTAKTDIKLSVDHDEIYHDFDLDSAGNQCKVKSFSFSSSSIAVIKSG